MYAHGYAHCPYPAMHMHGVFPCAWGGAHRGGGGRGIRGGLWMAGGMAPRGFFYVGGGRSILCAPFFSKSGQGPSAWRVALGAYFCAPIFFIEIVTRVTFDKRQCARYDTANGLTKRLKKVILVGTPVPRQRQGNEVPAQGHILLSLSDFLVTF